MLLNGEKKKEKSRNNILVLEILIYDLSSSEHKKTTCIDCIRLLCSPFDEFSLVTFIIVTMPFHIQNI